jgi:hypothetical protein
MPTVWAKAQDWPAFVFTAVKCLPDHPAEPVFCKKLNQD